MKAHVLTFAKQFMKGHPKAGEPTGFEKKLYCESKIHTIRSNYEYWKPKIEQVQRGEAFLSLRQWKGKPYRSKQREFMRVFDAGFQPIYINHLGAGFIGNTELAMQNVAKNDGLTMQDFDAWFDEHFEGIIIHFTDFRY